MAPALTAAGGQDPRRAGKSVCVCRIPPVFLLPGLVAGCQALAAVRQPAVTLGTQGSAAI